MKTAISLNQIGLYNPQRQSAEVTEALFVARQKQFELLLNKIVQEKENSIPQHYLVIGQRGMGKTTLLKRMEVELYKPPYRQRFVPLLFPEEQYNVKDLAVFWSNCLDALADSLQSEDKEKYHTQISDIDKTVRKLLLRKEPEIISEEAYQYLMNICRDLQRRPVLLIDNIGLVFNRLDINQKSKQGQWALRKLLSENGAPIIVSAGPAVTDDVINYGMPFYDFFQIQYLKKLRFEEFTELLENLADRTQISTDITPAIRKEKPRLQTLYQFTGGNPRTAVMLFKLLVKGFSADVTDDLDALVDEVTPLYKAKFEELPPQQQIIIDAIAMHWDAIPFKKLATDTGLAPNLLSSQLKRLHDDGWIETVVADKTSRKIKEEVEGVIKGSAYFIGERFFNTWFLIRRSNRRQKRGVHSLSEFLECLYGEERMMQEADRFLHGDITSSRQIMRGLSFAESKSLDFERKNKLKEKSYDAVINLSENDKEILEKYDIPKEFLVEKLPKLDILKITELTSRLKPTDAEFWFDIGCSSSDKKQHEKAIVFYNKAIEIKPDYAEAYNNRGIAKRNLSDYHGAIADYTKAIEIKPDFAQAYNNRGNAKSDLSDYHDAIDDYTKAIEIRPNVAETYHNRGTAKFYLSDYDDAIENYNKAIKINPKNLISKFQLIFLYRDKLDEKNKAIEVFNEIEQEINKNENKEFVSCYFLHKTLFELHKQNQGIAKELLLQAFEKEDNISSIANGYWWTIFGSVVLDLGYGSWLLAILEEKGYDIELSPYYTAIQALTIEKQDSKNGQKDAEIYLKNRAIEISEPARMIIEKMRKYMD